MDISLNKMGFNLEGVPLNIRQKLELIFYKILDPEILEF